MDYYLIGDERVQQLKNYQKIVLKQKLMVKEKAVKCIFNKRKTISGCLKFVKTISNSKRLFFSIGGKDLLYKSVDYVFAELYQLVEESLKKTNEVLIGSFLFKKNNNEYNKKVLKINRKLQKEMGKYFWMHKKGLNEGKIGVKGKLNIQGIKNFRRSIIGGFLIANQ